MNKIIVSIIFAIILVLGINKITDIIFYVEKPEKSAYQVASVTTVASTTSAETSSTNSNTGNIMALFASTSALSSSPFEKRVITESISDLLISDFFISSFYSNLNLLKVALRMLYIFSILLRFTDKSYFLLELLFSLPRLFYFFGN